MRLARILACTASFGTLIAAHQAAAQASTPQATNATAPAGDTPGVEEVVVTGIRASLASAERLKQVAPQVVDAIVAEDIGKLPDLNTAETAARIPGVQVYREGGEASNVLVRGLPFYTTTYNGREIFTAETRVVALQDFPSSNIEALEVFKTSTADLVEPGIAGIVNVRSRKAFDFSTPEVSGSVWGLYTRQGQGFTPNGNLLATKRFDTGIGEIGVLAEASFQDMRYLDAEISNTDFVGSPTYNGQTIRLPDIQRLYYRSGNRQRPSGDISIEWKASPNLEVYLEGLYQGFFNRIDDRLLQVPLYNGTLSNVQLRPGTNLVNSGTVTGPTNDLFSFQGGTYNRTNTFQFAGGSKYTSGNFKLSFDVARTLSTFHGNTESIDRVFNDAPTINFNSAKPSFDITGVNFTNPSSQTFQGLFEENQRSAGRDWQARVDGEYDFDNSPLKNIQVGFRYDDHGARRNYGNRYAFLLPLGINQSALPLSFNVFKGYNFQPTYNFVSPTYNSLQDNVLAMRQFIINECPAIVATGDKGNGCLAYEATNGGPAASPLIFSADEQTYAGYGQVNFGFGDFVTGTVGLRVQNDQLSLPNVPSGATTVNVNRSETDLLPNGDLIFHLQHNLQLRLAVAKTVTQPEFEQLGPITFGAPPASGKGTDADPYGGGGGNPYLQPFSSVNYDASLEYYFSHTGFASLAVFHRDLDKFIINSTARFTDPNLGVVEINGPINSQKGRITGAEAQGQIFLDMFNLPDWTKGIGAQASLTYVDFALQQTNASGGLSYQPYYDQLNGVSRWNYNIVGIYERGPVSARLTYNWRSKFPASYQNRGDDIYIETGHPAGRLDLSLQYRFLGDDSVFFDWTNITHTPFSQDESSARGGAPRAQFVRYLRYDESVLSLGVRLTLK